MNRRNSLFSRGRVTPAALASKSAKQASVSSLRKGRTWKGKDAMGQGSHRALGPQCSQEGAGSPARRGRLVIRPESAQVTQRWGPV